MSVLPNNMPADGTVDDAREEAHRYQPITGGWKITIDSRQEVCGEASDIGVVRDDPRKHRRPLYPEADRSVFNGKLPQDMAERLPHRPFVLAFNAPRFLFDCHHAGGLMGHLWIGYIDPQGKGAWLHDWARIEASYVNGHMEYQLTDVRFPDTRIKLTALPLAGASGAVFHWEVSSETSGGYLVFGYGGASVFARNHSHKEDPLTFHPVDCQANSINCHSGGFTLRQSVETARDGLHHPRCPAGLVAEIEGVSTTLESGCGDPWQMAHSPAALVNSTTWGGESREFQLNRVAVLRTEISSSESSGYLAIGMGVRDVVSDPQSAYGGAATRCEAIANRVRIKTPDPYLDSAATMAAFAMEGTWGDLSYLHGAWTWRTAYLGWRVWYGPNCYGWTQRVRTAIRNHIRLTLITQGEDCGGFTSTIEYPDPPIVYYNMNEVFFDHVRHYFDYTGDLELMREIFPVLRGLIEWENRRLRPSAESLYENSLNTWISDSHWRIQAQCTQASAYMLNAHNFMARLAELLGEEQEPWKLESTKIREALQSRLWQKRKGIYAEALETLGHCQLHPEPELPTLYHAAEFGAADALQIHQMLCWADAHLRTEHTAHGGMQVWSSNWQPNHARSYTHSTHELAYAETLNYALMNYQAGRSEHGWALLSSTLCALYNGPTPGGLSCHAAADGTQRNNDEFADSISMWGRAVLEGLFGIRPEKSEATVNLSPQFPAAWNEAAVDAPHFSYQWRRIEGREEIRWRAPEAVKVALRLPVRAQGICHVLVDGNLIDFSVEPGISLSWICVETSSALDGRIEVVYQTAAPASPESKIARPGERIKWPVENSENAELIDPQGILENARCQGGRLEGTVTSELGHGVLYLRSRDSDCPSYTPILIEVVPLAQEPPRVWQSPNFSDRNLGRWHIIDMTEAFNAPLTEVMSRVKAASAYPPLPACCINTEYRDGFFESTGGAGHGPFSYPVSDAAWRNKTGQGGIAWTSEGIPFKTNREGDNIAAVTLVGAFPKKIEVPVTAAGRDLYLMISGVTWPMQSHVVNLRLALRYRDGIVEAHDLVNPTGIGNCWDTRHGWWHDTAANGFENLGGRGGPSGSNEVADMTLPIAVDTEAHLLVFNLREGEILETISLEAIANDVVFGLMGAAIWV